VAGFTGDAAGLTGFSIGQGHLVRQTTVPVTLALLASKGLLTPSCGVSRNGKACSRALSLAVRA